MRQERRVERERSCWKDFFPVSSGLTFAFSNVCSPFSLSFSQASFTSDGICMDMRCNEFYFKVQEAKRFMREGIIIRYVGVIWFGFHVLQLLPIKLHNKIVCCISKSTMKHL